MGEMDVEKAANIALAIKALANPVALRVLGHLAEGPATLQDLAERIGVSGAKLGPRVGALVGAGLVHVDRTAPGPTFTLDDAALERLEAAAATLLAGVPGGPAKHRGHPAEGTDLSEEDKVLRDFFAGPRLTQIPARRKKLLIVLRYLLRRFEPGRAYPEKEVNALLREAHEDVATLRRNLVDFGFMVRANGIYRVAPDAGADISEETEST